MCRLVSYRHVIANAPARHIFLSPPLGWFFLVVVYYIWFSCVVWWRCFESTDCRERIFIYCIHTHRFLFSYSLLLFLKKKNAMKPNKLARVSFVKKKKKTRWWNEKGQLHSCLLFCPFPRLFLLSYTSGLWRLAVVALDMIRDKTVRSPKQDFLFLFCLGSFFLQDV